MGVTIKDIAKQTGVSIATVSHVINHTRYVSPELVKKVEDAINQSDYKYKLEKKAKSLMTGKKSVIAIVVPSFSGAIYERLVNELSRIVMKQGYMMATYFSDEDEELESQILSNLVNDKNIAGIILSPVMTEKKGYQKFLACQVPIVFLERTITGCAVDCILAENEAAIYRATNHLIKSGHEKIAIILRTMKISTAKEQLKGYKRALNEKEITYSEKYILEICDNEKEVCDQTFLDFYMKQKPTAIICCGNQITLLVFRMLRFMGLECPQDVSIIGFGDGEWCELFVPPLTMLKQNNAKMAEYAVEKLLYRIVGNVGKAEEIRVPQEFEIRKSTQMIGRGPFGEKAFSPDELIVTEEEKRKLREGNFKVAISFHYSGTAWKSLHEEGIRQTLEKYGINVISVMDAHFDPYLQMAQLESIAMLKPDAVIAIPADDSITAKTFKKLSKKTKLLFLSNVPEGLGTEDYVSCVSVNERENGHIVGTLLGEYYKGRKNVKVGFINHGVPFYGTHLRDMVASQTVCEEYSNIEIAAVSKFQNIDECYEICKNMIRRNPEIEGLYISWDRPALQAIRALKELGREDISIFTFDLDEEISEYLVKGEFVKGMSTQRPFEQGVSVARAAAKALVGTNSFKYIGVPPYMIQRNNFLRAWKDIMHEPLPVRLEQFLK